MRRLAPLGVVVLLVAAACSDDADTRAETAGLHDLGQDLESELWVLRDRPEVTLEFDDGERVSGEGGCNRYTGSYELENEDGGEGDLRITDLATTLRACEADVEQAEAAYLADLEAVARVEVDRDVEELTLTGDGVELVYDAEAED